MDFGTLRIAIFHNFGGWGDMGLPRRCVQATWFTDWAA